MAPILFDELIDGSREEPLKNSPCGWKATKAVGESAQAQALGDDGHPEMLSAGRDAAKVLPKCKTANDVERRQVIPHYQVCSLGALPSLPELFNQPVHGLYNQRLLGLERAIRKGAGQILAHLGVRLGISLAYNGQRFRGEVSARVEFALDERIDILADTVDVPPRPRRVKTELVWRHPNDRT